MKNCYVIEKKEHPNLTPSYCHKPLEGGYAMSMADRDGPTATLFCDRADAERALDKLPHGVAKQCEIIEIAQVPAAG